MFSRASRMEGWTRDETGSCYAVKGDVDACDPPPEARVPRLDRCCSEQKVGYGRHATQNGGNPPNNPRSEIATFLLWMQREGYSPSTINNVRKILTKLSNRLGTLLDGDAVKDFVVKMDARGGTKKLNLLAYKLYAKWKGFKFDL